MAGHSNVRTQAMAGTWAAAKSIAHKANKAVHLRVSNPAPAETDALESKSSESSQIPAEGNPCNDPGTPGMPTAEHATSPNQGTSTGQLNMKPVNMHVVNCDSAPAHVASSSDTPATPSSPIEETFKNPLISRIQTAQQQQQHSNAESPFAPQVSQRPNLSLALTPGEPAVFASRYGENEDWSGSAALQSEADVSPRTMLAQCRSKVQDWFASGGSSSRSLLTERRAAGGVLEREVAAVREALPVGYELGSCAQEGGDVRTCAFGQGLGALCRLLPLRAAGRTVGCVLVCDSEGQRDDLAQRARQSNVFPPRLGLIPPSAAPTLCFSCSWSLADTFAEEVASVGEASTPPPPTLADAAPLLLELCRVLEELHVSGYTVGELSPASFVKAGPVARSHIWHLNCLHSMLQQGTVVAHTVLEDDVQWIAPEQAVVAVSASAAGGARAKHCAQLVADTATDMFSFGLVAFRAVTGRSYWHGMSRDDTLACLTGQAPFPEVALPPAAPHGDTSAATALLPIIAKLLRVRVPSRPLASEVVATMQELARSTSVAGAAPAQSERSSFEACQAREPPPSPPRSDAPPSPRSPLADMHGTQPLKLSVVFAQCSKTDDRQRCLPTVRRNGRRIFALRRGMDVDIAVCIRLADSAAVPVFPLRTISHMRVVVGSAEGCLGGCDADGESAQVQTVDVEAQETLQGGGKLLRGVWTAASMLDLQESGCLHLHLYTHVVGFDDPVKISKRLHYMSFPCDAKPARQGTIMGSALQQVVTCTRRLGVHFEAHIPLSKAALAQPLRPLTK